MDEIHQALARVTKVETHPGILSIYRYDFLAIPRRLLRFVKTPICVVQPKNDEEVMGIMEVSEKFGIPIITRGAGTSGYGGCVPLEKCIVVDMKNFSKVIIQNNTALVESGAIWLDVERVANKAGKALRVYPTSASVSTVGGWIAQDGYGIGSLKYGDIGNNVEWLEVADYEGIKLIKSDKLKYYVGAFGTTGIILRACLRLREATQIKSFAFECSFEEALKKIEQAYHANFKDGFHMRCEKLGDKDTLLVSYEDGGESSGLGKILWERRLRPLKALTTDKIYSEAVVPYENALDFYKKAKELSLGLEAIFASDVVVFLGLFGRGLRHYLNALKFVKIAEKLGGGVYTTGMLFPHKNKAKKELREYKKTVDPKGLLNPKKALEENVFSKIMKMGERFLWIV